MEQNLKKYDMRELEGYFQCMKTPEETKAGINAVIVQLTRWFVETNDVCSEVYELKDCLDFLLRLRDVIDEVKVI